MRSATLLCLAAALAALASEPEVLTLDNGLTVIIQEMHYAPTVAVVVNYAVGSRNETDDMAGISHFLEHMMFNGTPSMPGSTFWQIVQMNGGIANGGTSYDQTSYMLYMPSGSLEEALRIESDRMQNLLLEPGAIAQEIGVVMDEWRLHDDSPYSALTDAANSAYYGDSPYRRRVIGTSEAIAAYDSAKVADYYRTWYVPGNAVLAIVGDIETDEALALVGEYFGPIPAAYAPEVDFADPPALDSRIDLSVEFPAEADRLLIYLDGCDRGDPDYPALTILGTYLSRGSSSWLQENLVTTGLATTAWAYASGNAGEGPFGVIIQPVPGVSIDSLETIVFAELSRLALEPLDEERLATVKGYYAGRQIMDLDDPLEVADQMAWDMVLTGDPQASTALRESIQSLTAEDIREVASRHFSPDRAIVAVLHAQPGGSGRETPTQGTTETVAPQVTDWEGLDMDPADLHAPDHSISAGTVRVELENGLTLLVREDHSFPVVEMIVALPMSDRRTSADRSGISGITAETMLWGAGGLGRSEFHARLMGVGGGTWLQPYQDFTLGNVYGPSHGVEMYFESMADLLIRPDLREQDFEQVRARTLEQDRMQREDPFALAISRFDDALLVEGSGREPDSATISGIGYPEMLDWYETCVRPDGSVLAIVGDITLERAVELAEEHLGGWEPPDRTLPDAMPPEFRTGAGVIVVEPIEGRMEAAVLFGCAGPPSSSPDYPAALMAAGILGGGIGSRMGMDLRETQGLAYAVGAYLEDALNPSDTGSRFTTYFMTGAPFAMRALEAAQAHCADIAEGGVLEEELLLRKFMSIGRHSLNNDTYDELALYLATREILGLPLDHDLTRLQATLALDAGDVQEAARRYLTGEWFVSAAGGIDQDLQPLE